MACQAAKLDLIDPFLSTTNDQVKEDKLASMRRLLLCNGLLFLTDPVCGIFASGVS